MSDLEVPNTNGWMRSSTEFAAVCCQCGALVASSVGDYDEWTERHVAWHMSLDEF